MTDSRYRFVKLAGAAALAGVVGAFVLATGAQAEEPYDITNCFAGTVTMLSASKELTVFSTESNGITQSHLENKAFNDDTTHCVGILRKMAGESVLVGYCKYMDPDGDFTIGQYRQKGTEAGKWEFLQGTGKWQGITGGGTYRVVTKGKPIMPGTFQYCSRATGTYTLPK